MSVVVCYISLIAIFAVYAPQIILFIIRKSKQPIKSKSPNLIIVSSIANMVITMASTNSLILCSNQNAGIAWKTFGSYLNIISVWLFFPMFVLPYILRALILFSIFSSKSDQNDQMLVKKQMIFYRYIIISIGIVFVGITITFCVLYSLHSSARYYMFPQILFADFMSDNYNNFVHDYRPGLLIGTIESFAEECSLIAAYFVLNTIHKDFNMVGEITIAASAWVVSTFLCGMSQVLTCFQHSQIMWINISYFIILARNIFCLLSSVTAHLISSFRKSPPFVPYGETIECCDNLGLVLSTETACSYFSIFLQQYDNKQCYLMLFMSIKLFDMKYQGGNTNDKKYAENVLNKFLTAKSPSRIPEYNQYVEALFESASNTYIRRNMFDCLYPLLMAKLREFFEEFKSDELYKELQLMLIRREACFERLKKAHLN